MNGDGSKITPFLPRTKGELLESPQQRGTWENNPHLLARISGDLDTGTTVQTGALTAIPTVWARPLLFAEALFDDKHPLHAEVQREWRGVLGCMALADLFKLHMRSEEFDVASTPRNRFSSTLLALLPGTSWNRIWLIYLNDQLVAGTSPRSLFFTRPEYRAPQEIVWKQSNGRLDDPVTFLKSQGIEQWRTELSVMKSWLHRVMNEIADDTIPDDNPANTGKNSILRLLREWINEIPAEIREYDGLKCGEPIVANAPYSYAATPCISVVVPEGDFVLDAKRNSLNAPIVCTENLWKQRDKRVFGSLSPEVVPLPKEPKVDSILPDKVSRPAITPDKYFFTERLLKMPTVDNNCVLHSVEGYIPPLRREVLDYFSREDLIEMFEWRRHGTSIEAQLKLPLKPNGKQRRYEFVRKLYETKDVLEIKKPPYLVIWPGLVVEGWNRYYSISKTPDTRFDLLPWYPGSSNISKAVRQDATIWEMKSYPECLECRYEGDNVGLILPRSPKPIEDGSGTWVVSVDFGTSNTCVFFKSARDGEPRPFVFENRCLAITQAAEVELYLFLLKGFIPSNELGGLFSSHFRQFTAGFVTEPLLNGVVAFDSVDYWPDMLRGDQLKENLKWSDDSQERRLIHTFLDQILLMIAAEARDSGVRHLELRWSYPKAFSVRMENDYRQMWGAIKASFPSSETGVEITAESRQTESAAVCRYMVGTSAATPLATDHADVIVDIGGGTSDIAVWLKGALVAQTSLLLAGRALSSFAGNSQPFAQKLSRMIGVPEAEKLLVERPAAALNVILKHFEDKVLAQLPAESPIQEIRTARSVIFCAISSVFYYVGLVLRSLSRRSALRGARILLAGNGSKLLNWVSNAEAVHNSLLQVLKAGLSPARLESLLVQFPDFPRHPKQEVARGLLYDIDYLEAEGSSVCFLCEQGFTVDDSVEPLPVDFDLEARRDILIPPRLRVPIQFVELGKFVHAYDIEAEKINTDKLGPLLDPVSLKTALEQYIGGLRGLKDADMATIQPIFVEEIKWLLARLSQSIVRPKAAASRRVS